EVVRIYLPQFSDWAILRKHYVTIRNLLEAIRPVARVEVRVKRLVRIVLCSIVLVTDAEVEGEPGLNLPRIVEVCRPLVIAIAAAEIRFSQRRGQRAFRRNNSCASVRVVMAGEFSLRESRHCKPPEQTIHKVVQRRLSVQPQHCRCIRISAKGTVVTNVNVLAAKPQCVVAVRPAHIFVALVKILRTTEWNSVSGAGREVPRKSKELTKRLQYALVCKVERR